MCSLFLDLFLKKRSLNQRLFEEEKKKSTKKKNCRGVRSGGPNKGGASDFVVVVVVGFVVVIVSEEMEGEGVSKVCPRCTTVIPPYEPYVNHYGNYYRPQCFTCVVCNKDFTQTRYG